MTEQDGRGGDEPFTDEVLAQFRKLQQATTKEERQQAIAAIAAAAARSHDSTDATATDDFHIYFEAYAEAKLKFEQAGQRLGRLMVDCITRYHTPQEPATEPEPLAKEMN